LTTKPPVGTLKIVMLSHMHLHVLASCGISPC